MPLDLLELVETAGAGNTMRPLTHPSDYSRGGLAVNATHAPEEWRPIPGWKHYEVSTHGRVRSLDRRTGASSGKTRLVKGRILHQSTVRRGYKNVTLTDHPRKRVALVHVLVMEAFVGPRPEGMEILHFDDVSSNNHLENLRYGSRLENIWDQVRNGRHYEASKTACDKGHEFDEANTRYTPSGTRKCRTCIREIQIAYRARKRVA